MLWNRLWNSSLTQANHEIEHFIVLALMLKCVAQN